MTPPEIDEYGIYADDRDPVPLAAIAIGSILACSFIACGVALARWMGWWS